MHDKIIHRYQQWLANEQLARATAEALLEEEQQKTAQLTEEIRLLREAGEIIQEDDPSTH